MENPITKSNGEGKERGKAYFHNPGSEPYRMVTVGWLVDQAALKWPNREAIISHHEKKTLTFGQVKEEVDKLAAGLLKLQLKPGDRLATLGVNSIHLYITMLAGAKAGLIVVPTNPAYRTQELGFSLKNAGAKCIVTDNKFKTQDYPGMLAELIPGMTSAPHGQPISCPELPDLSMVIVATDEKLPGTFRLRDVMSDTSVKDLEVLRCAERNIQPDDPLYIMYSSGTTGVPKGAVLSHFGTINVATCVEKRRRNYRKPTCSCLQLPMFHVFGNMGILSDLDNGNTSILAGPTFKKQSTIEVLKNYNNLMGTPTMFVDICNEIETTLPSSARLGDGYPKVDQMIIGGALCNSDLIKKVSQTFPNTEVMVCLGLTETSSACLLQFPNDSIEKKLTTAGFVLDNVEVKVVDEEGKMVCFGESGEGCFRSVFNFLEYWNNEEKSQEVNMNDGWLKTGDVMILSEDGYGSIVGRKKDTIIRGGENIFPSEIEEFLSQHPEIVDVQVFGVADERLGEEVAASIILGPSSTLTESSLKEYCKGKISHFKIPGYIRIVKEYPVTAIGKIKKYVLKEMLENELKRQKKEKILNIK